MSGELARAVRLVNERDITAMWANVVPAGLFWFCDALPVPVAGRHVDFILRDERVPIPQRGKDG